MTIITVKTGGIAADAVTDAKIADDVVGTEHLTANEVDTAALKADAVTGAQLADNAVNSEHYTDGSIDTAHIADAQITAAKLASGVGGKVLQVVTNSHNTRFVTTSTSYVEATGYSVTITPSATSSKVFIISSGQGDNEANGRIMYGTFYRTIGGGSDAHIGGDSEGISQVYGADSRVQAPMTNSMLDSPNTTSAVKYMVYIKNHGGQVSYNNNEGMAHFTAIEIAG